MIQVTSASIPAWSTLGIAEGTDLETGETVRFAGDHRPIRRIVEALEAGEEVLVEVEDWQVLARIPNEQEVPPC